jgi:glycosyltransferase involved in cell wall biosynthesis
MKISNFFVSAVLVVDVQTEAVAERITELSKILRARYANYEIVLVDNGITLDELVDVKALLPKVACIRVIRLSRSHDTDTAIFAGVEASIGDYVCTLYNNDPVDLVPEFIETNRKDDIVFGIATNLRRKGYVEELGARLLYWYSKRFLHINIPRGSTYFISMNRSAANALTRSGRFMRHIRHMAKRVGFQSTNLRYALPDAGRGSYHRTSASTYWSRAIDLISNYSNHPLRVVTYFGLVAGLLNVLYAVYVVVIRVSDDSVARGWSTLSLQSSLMFFILFLILALLAEYIGKILNETQQEPPYHIMQELSSTVSIADETRRNVTK